MSQAVDLSHYQNPSRISVPELLKELQVTKNELDNIRVSYHEIYVTFIFLLGAFPTLNFYSVQNVVFVNFRT